MHTDWVDVVYILAVVIVVYSGYRKSIRFRKDLNAVPNDMKEAFLRQRETHSFWEAGAARDLPRFIAVIGYVLAAIALIIILFYLAVMAHFVITG